MSRNKEPRTGVARALSKLGHCSRTDAARLVAEGRVTLNGKTIRDPQFPVRLSADRLAVDGRPVAAAPLRYLMLNKPRGLVTTVRDERGRDTVYRCLDDPRDAQLMPVGRLDKASEGLLLFTNDRAWAHRLTDPESHVLKTYHVQVTKRLSEAELAALHVGVRSGKGVELGAASASILREGEKNCWLEIVLDEGKNRHIRRMLQVLGIEVLRLVRVGIGPLRLGGLAKGASRELTPAEHAALEVCGAPEARDQATGAGSRRLVNSMPRTTR